MNILTSEIISTLTNIVNSQEFVPLHTPIFKGNEIKYVTDCIKSNFVSSVGEYTKKFEAQLSEYLGAKRVVLTVNGTSALHVCLMLSGVEANDEVLMPALTFVATANAVAYIGATPHFVDVDDASLGVDSIKLSKYLSAITVIKNGECFNKDTGKRIKAIVPMHTFGHMSDMDAINAVAGEYFIDVIEDAAESLGSLYKGKQSGTLSKLAALSFNGNKIITAGGGGAIVTNDDNLADKAVHITTTAKKPHKWEYHHDMVGYNYRMPAINAALALAQLENLDEFLLKKRALAIRYKEAFAKVAGVKLFMEPEFSQSNYWLNALILDEGNEQLRDEVLEHTNNNLIMTRPVWDLLDTLNMYKDSPKMDLTVSRSLAKRIINIPSSAWVGS